MFSTANEWKEEGNLRFSRSDYKGALEAYDAGLKIDASTAVLWNNKGVVLDKLGHYSAAEYAFSQAIRLKPDYTKAKDHMKQVKSKIKTILEFKKPEKIFYEGLETDVSEIETKFMQPMTNRLWAASSDFSDYKHYSLNEITANYLNTGLDIPEPLSADYFNIISMGEYGHGVVARKTILKNTVVGYYLGQVSAGASTGSPHDLALWNNATASDLSNRYKIRVDHEWSLMSLLQHLPHRGLLTSHYECKDETRVAAANISYDTINLFVKGSARGAAIVVLYAREDIDAGNLIGFDYGLGYFRNRAMQPVLFDKESFAPIPESGFKALSTAFYPFHRPVEIELRGKKKYLVQTLMTSFGEQGRAFGLSAELSLDTAEMMLKMGDGPECS